MLKSGVRSEAKQMANGLQWQGERLGRGRLFDLHLCEVGEKQTNTDRLALPGKERRHVAMQYYLGINQPSIVRPSFPHCGGVDHAIADCQTRSEERRVGKECRS